MLVIEIREYVDAKGRSPYARWFNRLPAQAAAKVAHWSGWSKETFPASRVWVPGSSNAGSTSGPGYRVYFGKDGDTLIILLGGGTKKHQQQDIETVRTLWREYKQRKRRETWPCP